VVRLIDRVQRMIVELMTPILGFSKKGTNDRVLSLQKSIFTSQKFTSKAMGTFLW